MGESGLQVRVDKMTTLVIHAPDYRVRAGVQSFEDILADGIGKGYAISKNDISKLPPGSTVALLRKGKNERRAEGRLVKLVATGGTTPQGIRRYDVHIKDLQVVPYKDEELNHYGYAVIEWAPQRQSGKWASPAAATTFEKSLRFYKENFQALHRTYAGKYIALTDNQVVDFDGDFSALAKRVYKKVGYLEIFMPKVEERRPIHIPTPRLH